MGKKDKKAKAGDSFKDKLKASIADKNPILLFLLVFGALMGLFYAVWITEFFTETIFNPVLHFYARLAGFILNLFGYGTVVSGMNISNADFSISVKRGCDAIEPIALFASAVLAFPASFKKKMPGIAAGVAFLLAVNLIRIVSLFLTGLYAPALFDFMHMEVWQVVFILLALVCWVIWIRWSQQKAGVYE
ncbi:MAG: exosortase H [Chitinophagales bacterium]|nr:exosortase H [Chitinophagales bacterium]